MSAWTARVGDVARKDVATVFPNQTVKEAADLMYRTGTGSVVVITPERTVIGIFTERDLTRVVAEGLPHETQVGSVMTRDPVTVKSTEPLSKAIELMAEKKVRHLPVVDSEGRLVGIITSRDVVELTERYLASAGYVTE